MNKVLKAFAALQILGGVGGAFLLAHDYGPAVMSGKVGLGNIVILCILLSLCMLPTWGGLSFWRRPKGKQTVLKLALLLQTISISFSGFVYEFYAGLSVPFGLVGNDFGVSFSIDSKALLAFPETAAFGLTFNLGAVIFLMLLTRASKVHA